MQQDRHWDFKEQKWVTEESNAIEGTFDKEGKFEAKLDLQDEFKDFNPEDYSHYEDLTLQLTSPISRPNGPNNAAFEFASVNNRFNSTLSAAIPGPQLTTTESVCDIFLCRRNSSLGRRHSVFCRAEQRWRI